MNLHAVVGPVIASINPTLPASLRLSAGVASTAADGTQVPGYETPGAFVGSIADRTLTVASVSAGVLAPGQGIAGAGVTSGTVIEAYLSGTGGAGTYAVSKSQTVGSEAMTTSDPLVPAQIQPMTWQDLQKLDGLNLSGTRVKIYLYGSTDSVVRVQRKGGDLIRIATGGTHDGVYLVAQVLEQFADWVCVACTLQDEDTFDG